MKKVCVCGDVHCCHVIITEKVIVDEDSGREFIRQTCSDCSTWLGDKPN